MLIKRVKQILKGTKESEKCTSLTSGDSSLDPSSNHASEHQKSKDHDASGHRDVFKVIKLNDKIRRLQSLRTCRRPITMDDIRKKADKICVVLTVDDIKAEKNTLPAVVDPGTTYRISREKENFEEISGARVTIKGVGGIKKGWKGTLKPNKLGKNLPAIYFPECPVPMLLSTQGLKQNSWETHFELTGDRIVNKLTGTVLTLNTDGGLPRLDLEFSEEAHCDYVITPHDYENTNNERSRGVTSETMRRFKALVATLPRRMRKAVVTTQKARRLDPEKRKKQDAEKMSRLLRHWRLCHFFEPNQKKATCFDCLECKGRKKGHDKQSDPKYEMEGPLVLVSTDFFGEVKPTSYRGAKWVLLFVCDSCGFVHGKALRSKAEAPDALIDFVQDLRNRCGIAWGQNATADGKIVVAGIHSDNEPVLRSEAWAAACRQCGIKELHSAPYEPQMNGTVERMAQTIKGALRTTTASTDPRLWDFCLEHVIRVWNLKENKAAGKCCGKRCSPSDVVAEISDNPLQRSDAEKFRHLRRYGCLAYFKPHAPKDSERNAALARRCRKGIRLGISPANSAWLIGTTQEGRLHVYETRNAVFVEEILVRNVKELDDKDPPIFEQIANSMEEGNADGPCAAPFVSVDASAPDGKMSGVSGSPGLHLDAVTWEGMDESRSKPPREVDLTDGDTDQNVPDIDLPPESIVRKVDGAISEREKNFPLPESVRRQGNDPLEIDIEGNDPPAAKRQKVNNDSKVAQASGATTYGPPTAARKGPGKRGPDKKPRTRRTKKQMAEDNAKKASTNFDAFLAKLSEDDADRLEHLRMEDGEELLEAEVFLARDFECPPGSSEKASKAFGPENPFRPKWIEAKELEQARLEGYKTWRRLNAEEEEQYKAGKLRAVPCALLLNRKRCGRFKGRLVVLGNRWENDTDLNSVYASVVSSVGNRVALVLSARYGFYAIPFDIRNAFLNASMGDIKVCVRLPPQFCNSTQDSGLRMLLKALYGLPISPRMWSKTLARDLASLGWRESSIEPGVWVLREGGAVVGLLTVYVDDCLLACVTEERTRQELDKIHQKHKLDVMQVKKDTDGNVSFDLLGCDIVLNPSKRTLRMSMEVYIRKLLKRFDMESAKGRNHPSFDEANLYNANALPSTFKFRAVVGALQWLCCSCRPDLAHATNMLARASSRPVTNSMAKCARLVLRYLSHTVDVGLTYSPEQETEFYDKFRGLCDHPENVGASQADIDSALHSFSDASFGVVYQSMKSISGSLVCLYGFPVAWKSKAQSVFTSSTVSSECVALSDAIELEQSVYGLLEFIEGKKTRGPLWSDNRGAVITARKGESDRESIPKKSRRIALRFCRVLGESDRVMFSPTSDMKADGLTKSRDIHALQHLFTNFPSKIVPQLDEEVEGDEEFMDYSSHYLVLLQKLT